VHCSLTELSEDACGDYPFAGYIDAPLRGAVDFAWTNLAEYKRLLNGRVEADDEKTGLARRRRARIALNLAGVIAAPFMLVALVSAPSL
jgi:hypothetical protein